ncbi:MAG: adenylate/guanylate cyclase domain-containing protein [Burkholderiales bacterium]
MPGPDDACAAAARAGTAVTQLFTDLEGSTLLWERAPDAMRSALAAHDALARRVVAARGGTVVKTAGDGLHAAFVDAAAALAATVDFQVGLAALATAHGLPLRARCGLHTGVCEARDGDYFGPTVNRAARIMSAGAGGQVLLSQAVAEAAGARLPDGARLVDVGLARLRDLARPDRLYQLAHPALPDVFPPLRSLDATPNNLPLQLTSFLGREADAAQVRALLDGGRLVTLTGPGGIGKTRLALQVAADAVERFVDGVWLVDLAPLAEPGQVATTVAQVLRVREDASTPVAAALAAHVADRQLLLVLDNCEHLVGACAELAASLLATAPGLAVVATSREPLRVAGERVWALAPLGVPVDDDPAPGLAPAVRLFVERARDTRPGFSPAEADLQAIGALCRRLDGIPLAIELAAARMRALSVAEIGRRLDDRFRLLTGGHRAQLPRQRTLEATIAWSYELLEAAERVLFVRLSVFAGGFELDAVQRVCADADDAVALVDALVAKSLVLAYERNGATRYRMLDSIREFARERLGTGEDAAALRDAHAAWCVELARKAHDALRGPGQAAWCERLDAELDNLRGALAWTAERATPGDEALALAAMLWRYWHLTGRMTEGRAHTERALALPAATDAAPSRADALYAAGALAKNQSDLAEAARRLEEASVAFAAQGRERDAAAALGSLGNVRQDQGDLVSARALHEQAYAMFCRVGDRAAEATALLNLGSIAMDLGERDRALDYHERSLGLARAHGLGAVECMGESNLGELALDRGDGAAARAHFTRALDLGRRLPFRAVAGTALASLAMLARADGDAVAARRMAAEGVRILAETGAQAHLIEALEAGALLCAEDGAVAVAANVLAATEAARDRLALPLLARARAQRERVQAALGVAPARAAGSACPLPEAARMLVGALFVPAGDAPGPRADGQP